MSEIKSTLDLVMERTRHLTLSPEEKQDQQLERFDQRLRGLLQQYADGALTVEQLNGDIAALQNQLAVIDNQRVGEAIADRIDPDADNQRWLALLATFRPASRQPIEEALITYSQRQAHIRQAAEVRCREHLERQDSISGSAVLPNASRDATYRQRMATLRLQTHNRIRMACSTDGGGQ